VQAEDVGLEDVLEQREAAGHVAVERGVADRELRLVPVATTSQPNLFDSAISRTPRTRACRFSSAGRPRAPRSSRPATPSKAFTISPIGSSRKSVPRLSASRRASPRVASEEYRDGIETQWTRSAPSASTAERGCERGVDPARDADHDVAEPVLLDVVAQAQLEREAHLLELVERRGDWASTGSGFSSLDADVDDRRLRHGSTLPGERAAPHVAQAATDRVGGSTSTTSSASSNPGARASTCPPSSSTSEWPSKISSSWPPTALQKATKQALSRARVANISSRSRSGRRGTATRRCCVSSCAPASARSVRAARLPHVLADRRADQRAAVLEQNELAGRGEVPILVEHAVVGQEPLPVERLHLAAGADGARVEEVAVEVRRADQRDDPVRRARDLAERLSAARTNPGRRSRSSGG
jgi:hypothetical protein